MKRFSAFLVILLASAMALPGYPVYFKEQYYKLYHAHYVQYPDDTIENIYWLERAIAADFCNPLYALSKIEDKRQWERYRYLFNMHLELKMIEQHLYLGSKFDKRVAYFYNAPWKRENLESLATAETAYKAALSYWASAKEWAAKAEGIRFLYLPDVQFWEDEAFRIMDGQLDYGRIIGRELERLAKVRSDFEAMDEASY
ncbi:MAG: hypothetical protein KKA67_09685 [Spirochaetes bacterium]|nr:hypothetical protein [Spirochaetota bacterium]MBU1080727.1 hypothetical protein [Spirochaetota bacterium]